MTIREGRECVRSNFDLRAPQSREVARDLPCGPPAEVSEDVACVPGAIVCVQDTVSRVQDTTACVQEGLCIACRGQGHGVPRTRASCHEQAHRVSTARMHPPVFFERKRVGCRNWTRRVPPPALTGHASCPMKPRGRDPGGAAAHRADAVGEARVRLVAPGRGGNGQVVRKLRTMADLALSRGAPPGPASGRNASGRGGGGGCGGFQAQRLVWLVRGKGRGVSG